MTTEEFILNVKEQWDRHSSKYAVFKPQSITNGVDFQKASQELNTDEIHGYTMIDKIIVWSSKEEMDK